MARWWINPKVVKAFARSTTREIGAKAKHTVLWGAMGVLGAWAAADRVRNRFLGADGVNDRRPPVCWQDDLHLARTGPKAAVLTTLGECLPENLALDVADQVPLGLANPLLDSIVLGGAGAGEPFDAPEFIRRVAVRSGRREADAARIVPDVLDQLESAVDRATFDHVREVLPSELANSG